MQFYLQNTPNLEGAIPPSWRSLDFLRKVFQWIDRPSVSADFIDMNMEFCPYYLGFDPVHLNLRDSFALLANTEETDVNVEKLEMFARYLESTYELVARDRLILLFERCIHYEKLKFAKQLMSHEVGRFNLDFLFELILHGKAAQAEKDSLLAEIAKQYPETFRRYKWEEIFRVYLNSAKDGTPFTSYHFSQCYLNKEQINSIVRRSGGHLLELDNKGISRNDYMYILNRGVSKLKDKDFEFYVERVELPGVDFFFSKVIDALKAHYIKPLTTYITLHDTYLQCTESLKDGFSISQAVKTFSEGEITNLVDRSILSEAIIISLLLYPMEISFDDLILQKCASNNELFFLYVKSIYCHSAYAQQKDGKELKLRVKNALFLLDIMQETVPMDVVEKYANINVLDKVRTIFDYLQEFGSKAGILRQSISAEKGSFGYDLPFLGIPFEKDFSVQMAYRFFVISETFNSVLTHKIKHTSHFELFEKLDAPVAYYYKKVARSSKSLMDRWDLLNRLEARNRSFVGGSLFGFYSSFTWWEQPEYSDFPSDLSSLKFIGPGQSLKALTDQQYKSQVFLQRDSNAIKEMLQSAPTTVASFFMKNLDLSNYPPNVQDEILAIYADISKRYQINAKKHSALQGMNLLGCSILDSKHFTIFAYERVQHITLVRCEKLTEPDLAYLANHLPCLAYMRLIQIRGLQCFSSKRSFAVIHEEPITFKSLKTLIISKCEELTLIDVSSPALSNIELSYNSKLESIFALTPDLKNINSYANPQLHMENLAIYILQGKNVLVDDVSCSGQFAKLSANKDPARDSYTQKVCKLFTHLVGKFDQGEVKNNLLVTMFKTKLLDSNLSNEIFTVFSAIVTRYITSNIKLSPKLEEDLLTNIIKCFYRNDRITEIYLDDFQSLDDKLKTKALSRFVACLNEVSKTTPVLYKSIHLSKVLSEHTLQLLVETAKYLRKDNTLDLFVSHAHESKQYVEIVRNLCRAGTLQRLRLILQQTNLDEKLFTEILETCSAQLNYLRLEDCQIQVEKLAGSKLQLEKCKTLVLKNCELHGHFEFVREFPNVSTFEMEDGTISDFEGMLRSLTQSKQLTNLALKGVILTSADLISLIGYLENNVVESLDLSNSILTNADM